MDNQDKKRELIIEAALKRFAHFGLSKTTMNEIASDISLSKALLYYYFPDKISLFAAVMETIIAKMEVQTREGLKEQKTSQAAMLFYLDKRQEFVRKYFNLLEFAISMGSDIPLQLEEIFVRAKNIEKNFVLEIVENEIRTRRLDVEDPLFATEILLDALAGMRANHFAPSKNFYPDSLQFDQILKKEKSLSIIFLNGLK